MNADTALDANCTCSGPEKGPHLPHPHSGGEAAPRWPAPPTPPHPTIQGNLPFSFASAATAGLKACVFGNSNQLQILSEALSSHFMFVGGDGSKAHFIINKNKGGREEIKA